MDRARQLAEQLCVETSPESIKRIKNMLARQGGMPLTEALTYAAQQNAEARSTEDCRRGIDAFLSKSKRTW